jgi:hypothetical protein
MVQLLEEQGLKFKKDPIYAWGTEKRDHHEAKRRWAQQERERAQVA